MPGVRCPHSFRTAQINLSLSPAQPGRLALFCRAQGPVPAEARVSQSSGAKSDLAIEAKNICVAFGNRRVSEVCLLYASKWKFHN